MASITQTIPQYSLGMSEQPDHLKFPGQVTEVINAIPDVTRGLFKRPGAKRIDTSAITGDSSRQFSTNEGNLKSVQSGGSWFHYFRDETEGSYIGQVAADGQLRVWRCSDGRLMTTVYGTGGQTAIQNYLQTATPENLQFLTINDTTFVCNRDSSNYTQAEITGGGTPAGKSAGDSRDVTQVGITGTTQARPHTHFGFIELLRTENGRQYGLNIKNTATVDTVTRATRIKILRDDLDESDGSGHCPGIGTQVFSVTAASDYTGTTTNEVLTIPTTPTQTINFTFQFSDVNHTDNKITLNSHGLVDGQKVRYTMADGGTAIQNLPVDTDYYVVKINDNEISLSTTFANATASPAQVVNIGSTAA